MDQSACTAPTIGRGERLRVRVGWHTRMRGGACGRGSRRQEGRFARRFRYNNCVGVQSIPPRHVDSAILSGHPARRAPSPCGVYNRGVRRRRRTSNGRVGKQRQRYDVGPLHLRAANLPPPHRRADHPFTKLPAPPQGRSTIHAAWRRCCTKSSRKRHKTRRIRLTPAFHLPDRLLLTTQQSCNAVAAHAVNVKNSTVAHSRRCVLVECRLVCVYRLCGSLCRYPVDWTSYTLYH